MGARAKKKQVTEVPRLVIAGVSSGVGKTTVTVALARALRDRGLRVALFKCGPDYLDPTYHRLASARPSHNLDGWMMGREAVVDTLLSACDDADIALIEGVMGLFDGASPTSDEGSTAEIARWLSAPVLLVLDASGMARSVAALARGFAEFDPELNVAGVFCNRVGSAGHLTLLERACEHPPILGGLLKREEHTFPSRHLGLRAADEVVTEADLAYWAARLVEHTDLERLLTVARSAPALASDGPNSQHETSRAARSPRCRIGIAHDAAFSFYYPYNLRLLESLGAELVPFSPLSEATLPEVDGLYFGGGYPELHALALSANHELHASLRAFAERGWPIYAECGGLMFLSDAIVDLEGRRHAMVGLVSGTAVMQPCLCALGYAEVETLLPTVLGPAGQRLRGHQFRYSRFETDQPPENYRLTTKRTQASSVEGHGRGSVLASYVHAHWASNPQAAEGFVNSCERLARL